MIIYKGPAGQILLPLQKLSGIVERKQTMQIASHVLFEPCRTHITLTTTDLDIQVRTKFIFDNAELVEHEQPSFTVNSAKLLDIIRSYSGSTVITIKLDKNKVIVSGVNSKFQLQTMKSEDFPLIINEDVAHRNMEIEERRLKSIIALCQNSIAIKEVRYYLKGMNFVVEGAKLIGVASDGHRLAYAAVEISDKAPEMEYLLPRKSVVELNKLLNNNDNKVAITVSNNQIKYEFANIEFISKLIDAKFPNHKAVIPVDSPNYLVINRKNLLDILNRMLTVASEIDKVVILNLVDNTIMFDLKNANNEEAHDEIEVTRNSEAQFNFGFNIYYLTDVLTTLDQEFFKWEYNDSKSGTLITIPDSYDFKYVLMPMQS